MAAPLASFMVSAAVGLGRDAAAGLAQSLDPKAAKARKTADDFEALFLEQTLDRMFASIGDDGPLGENGTGGPVYRSMLVKEYAGTMVKSGGVGIGDQVFREIMRMQEGASIPGAASLAAKPARMNDDLGPTRQKQEGNGHAAGI